MPTTRSRFATGLVLVASLMPAGRIDAIECRCATRNHFELFTRTNLSLDLSVQGCAFDQASGAAFSAASGILFADTRQRTRSRGGSCTTSICDGGLRVGSDSDGATGDLLAGGPISTVAVVDLDGVCTDIAAEPFGGSHVAAGAIEIATSAGLSRVRDATTTECPCSSFSESGLALESARGSGRMTLELLPDSPPCAATVRVVLSTVVSLTRLVCPGEPPPFGIPPGTGLAGKRSGADGGELVVHFVTLASVEDGPDGLTRRHDRHGVLADGFQGGAPVSARLGFLDDPALAPETTGPGARQVAGSVVVSLPPSEPGASTIALEAATDTFSRFGDLDRDGRVCRNDRAALATLAAWKAPITDPAYDARADFDLDGAITSDDLARFDEAGFDEACDACACLGDIDRNGAVDEDDIDGFVDCLLGQDPEHGCACADLDGSGTADGLDIQLFTERMLRVGGACHDLTAKDCDANGVPDYVDFTLGTGGSCTVPEPRRVYAPAKFYDGARWTALSG